MYSNNSYFFVFKILGPIVFKLTSEIHGQNRRKKARGANFSSVALSGGIQGIEEAAQLLTSGSSH